MIKENIKNWLGINPIRASNTKLTSAPTTSTHGTYLRCNNTICKETDDSPLLLAEGKTYILQVLGVLLYYRRAVDATIVVALSSIASMQAAPTALTMELTKMLLDYVATHLDAILTYKKATWC